MNNVDDPAALRNQLAVTEQLQEMLLFMITHELRTPVMTIMGFADILLGDWQSGTGIAQSQPHLERIRSAAQRQSTIIQGLQQIASLQCQSMELDYLNPGEVVRNQLDKILPAQHNFQTRIEDVDPVPVDSSMMTTAVYGLLSIVTTVARLSPVPLIEFGREDKVYFLRGNGAGFDLGTEQTLPLLLRRLQSGTDFPGAGMNLLVAATIIGRHKGKLRFSTAANRGITFEFTVAP